MQATIHAVPSASIVVPTRQRPDYLEVTLASIAPQAQRRDAEIVVVSDGSDRASGEIAARHGARVISLPEPTGLNVARNAGARSTNAELIVFIDDDVEAP